MRQTFHLTMFFFLAIIGFADYPDAAIYYVNNSGSPACVNSGNGTLAKPYCTIAYAISRMSGGDTVYVRAGTYNEQLYITGPAGNASSNTTIAVYPGDTVLLLGNGTNTGRCKIANTNHITLQGFTITNSNQGLFIDSSTNIVVNDCTIHHVGQEGLHIHYNSSNVTIDHCLIHDTRQWQYDGEGIYIGTSDAAPVDNTNNVMVRNTTIYNAPDEGIELKIGTHHITIEGNTIYNVNLGSDWSQNGNDVGAIEVNNAVGSVQNYGGDPQQVIRNNFIHDVKTAIRAGTGSTVYNNVIWNVRGYGIYVDNQSNDPYTRAMYHNTIDATPANAVFHVGGAQDVRNNIGPATARNLPTQDAYYVDKAGADYHLVKGTAPIDAGDDLTSIVPTDRDGVSRKTNGAPDMGAYEYSGSSRIGESAVPGPVSQDLRLLTFSKNKIDYAVSQAGNIDVQILDISGRPIRALLDTWTDKGIHSISWNMRGYPAGIYLFRLVAGESSLVQKEIILK
ncbi:MAG: right-handed parallel beta-helix repeat-containing protein [Chitinivibrionales bacterium]